MKKKATFPQKTAFPLTLSLGRCWDEKNLGFLYLPSGKSVDTILLIRDSMKPRLCRFHHPTITTRAEDDRCGIGVELGFNLVWLSSWEGL